MTGHGACAATCWLTEPSSSPAAGTGRGHPRPVGWHRWRPRTAPARPTPSRSSPCTVSPSTVQLPSPATAFPNTALRQQVSSRRAAASCRGRSRIVHPSEVAVAGGRYAQAWITTSRSPDRVAALGRPPQRVHRLGESVYPDHHEAWRPCAAQRGVHRGLPAGCRGPSTNDVCRGARGQFQPDTSRRGWRGVETPAVQDVCPRRSGPARRLRLGSARCITTAAGGAARLCICVSACLAHPSGRRPAARPAPARWRSPATKEARRCRPVSGPVAVCPPSPRAKRIGRRQPAASANSRSTPAAQAGNATRLRRPGGAPPGPVDQATKRWVGRVVDRPGCDRHAVEHQRDHLRAQAQRRGQPADLRDQLGLQVGDQPRLCLGRSALLAARTGEHHDHVQADHRPQGSEGRPLQVGVYSTAWCAPP